MQTLLDRVDWQEPPRLAPIRPLPFFGTCAPMLLNRRAVSLDGMEWFLCCRYTPGSLRCVYSVCSRERHVIDISAPFFILGSHPDEFILDSHPYVARIVDKLLEKNIIEYADVYITREGWLHFSYKAQRQKYKCPTLESRNKITERLAK